MFICYCKSHVNMKFRDGQHVEYLNSVEKRVYSGLKWSSTTIVQVQVSSINIMSFCLLMSPTFPCTSVWGVANDVHHTPTYHAGTMATSVSLPSSMQCIVCHAPGKFVKINIGRDVWSIRDKRLNPKNPALISVPPSCSPIFQYKISAFSVLYKKLHMQFFQYFARYSV